MAAVRKRVIVDLQHDLRRYRWWRGRTDPLFSGSSRVDVVRAYSRGMLDRLQAQHQHPVLHRELRGTQMVEMTVRPNGPMAERRLAELTLPPDSLVIAVERGEDTVIPRGDTQLLPGDKVVFLVREGTVPVLHERLGRPIPRATPQ